MSGGHTSGFEAHFRATVERVGAAVDALAASWARRWPARLAEAGAYCVGGGGKRVRPLLACLTGEVFALEPDRIIPWALAVELIHTYSLVHDDLPAMDDDDFRRGRPSCHRAYDEATAILVGDALLTEAFDQAATLEPASALVSALSRAAGGDGMVGGQALDVASVQPSNIAELEDVHARKTGALIRVSAVGAALVGAATRSELEAVGRYGSQVGLLFQITDDLLDAEDDAAASANTFLRQLGRPEVEARRDVAAAEAHRALAALGRPAPSLAAFIELIARRTA